MYKPQPFVQPPQNTSQKNAELGYAEDAFDGGIEFEQWPNSFSAHSTPRERLLEHPPGVRDATTNVTTIPPSSPLLREFRQRAEHVIWDSWLPEICSWVLSLTFLVAVIIVLSVHDARPLPDWPYDITLNTLITLLVTLMTTALMVPSSQGLSQLKWIWFADRRINSKASDLDKFDKASRGAYGSLLLLLSPSGTSLTLLGALITLLALAANAVSQQTITYVPRLALDLSNGSATSPRATYFDLYDFVSQGPASESSINIKTEAAIYAGLLSGNTTYPIVRPSCSTGNCTWPAYESLGVCASLADVTPRLLVTCEYSYGSPDACNATLPGVATLTTQGAYEEWIVRSVGQLPLKYNSQEVKSIAFRQFLESTVADFFILFNPVDSKGYGSGKGPSAIEINLKYCVQTLESEMKKGKPWTNLRGVHTRFKEGKYESESNLTAILDGSSERFIVGPEARSALYSYMQTQFNGRFIRSPDGSGGDYPTTAIKAIVNALRNPPYNTEGLKILAANLATSMTNHFRAAGYAPSQAIGTAKFSETVVNVSWPWITLLVVIEIATLIFLFWVIAVNHHQGCKLWRSSNLALVQAMQQDSRASDMVGLDSNAVMRRRAHNVNLKLREQGKLWALHRDAQASN